MLLGVLLLGAGAVVAAGDGPRLVADELGTVPAAAGPATTGPAGGAASRPVPARQVLPVLARPEGAAGGSPDSAVLPGAPASEPEGSGPAAPGSAPPDLARPDPAPPPAARRTGPAPIGPRLPWTVSPIYPPPAGPGPAGGRARTGGPVVPSTLHLPDRGIVAPVTAVGTGPNGGMVVPEQVDTVGWWAPGVLPGGAAGSTVIAGHVDSATQGLGVLAVLPRLTAGEPVVVRGADGRMASYRVVARREYDKHDLPREIFRRDGPPQLVLVTCGGVFDPAAGSYESNIVVYAVPAYPDLL